MDLAPIDTAVQRDVLRRKNRRLMAERLGWPEEAIGVCEDGEKAAPGWALWWTNGVGRAWNRKGYYAQRGDGRTWQWVYGATAEELVDALVKADPDCRWKFGVPVDGLL